MEKKFTTSDFDQMERFYRVHLINSLSGYKSSHLVGTMNNKGNKNLAIFNSVIHIGANPAYMGVLFRPHTIPRHTYENIKATGCFTLNHLPLDYIRNGHQTSAKYDAETSEFDACGFTPMMEPDFQAPFVKEAAVKIGLSFVEEHLIKANDTILVVGAIKTLMVPTAAVADTGHIHLEQCHSSIVCGLDTYFKADRLFRLSYARPNDPIREI